MKRLHRLADAFHIPPEIFLNMDSTGFHTRPCVTIRLADAPSLFFSVEANGKIVRTQKPRGLKHTDARGQKTVNTCRAGIVMYQRGGVPWESGLTDSRSRLKPYLRRFPEEYGRHLRGEAFS
eukprot:839148-Prorocentrum_minimum.AAC.1